MIGGRCSDMSEKLWNIQIKEVITSSLKSQRSPSNYYNHPHFSIASCQILYQNVRLCGRKLREEGGEPTLSMCFFFPPFFSWRFRSVPPPVKRPRCNSQPVIWTTSNLTSRKLLLTVITQIRKYPACLCFIRLMAAYLQLTRRKQSDVVKIWTTNAWKQKAGQTQSIPPESTRKRVYGEILTGDNWGTWHIFLQWFLCTLIGTVTVFVLKKNPKNIFCNEKQLA